METFPQLKLLLEMPKDRPWALKKIAGEGKPLANHMIILEHCPEDCSLITHWSEEIKTFLDNINKYNDLKKQAELTRSDFEAQLWEAPLGEYKLYLKRYKRMKEKEKEIKFTPPSQEAWLEIKRKYVKVIDGLLNRTSVPYAKLKD